MERGRPVPRKKLQELYYRQGKSMKSIGSILGCNEKKVLYWMKKYNMKRRSWSEATYVKLNPDGDPFRIKTVLSPSEKLLYGLGLGIYWGEGNKSKSGHLAVANTDPEIHKTFIKFLKVICRIKSQKLLYSIVCFNDVDPDQSRNYWARQLKILPEKFGKITQIPSQGKGNYKKKSRYGVCTVWFNNVKLKRWILEEINKVHKILPR